MSVFCKIFPIFVSLQIICGRHIEEAFSAIPPVESGQFKLGSWNRIKRSSLDRLYTLVYILSWV